MNDQGETLVANVIATSTNYNTGVINGYDVALENGDKKRVFITRNTRGWGRTALEKGTRISVNLSNGKFINGLRVLETPPVPAKLDSAEDVKGFINGEPKPGPVTADTQTAKTETNPVTQQAREVPDVDRRPIFVLWNLLMSPPDEEKRRFHQAVDAILKEYDAESAGAGKEKVSAGHGRA